MDDDAFLVAKTRPSNFRNYVRRARSASLVFAYLFLLHGIVSAQSSLPITSTTNTVSPAAALDLAAKRAKVTERISKLTASEGDTSADKNSAGVEDAEEELDLLRSLDLLYVQHQSTIEQRIELLEEKRSIQEQIDTLTKFGLDEPKPYSYWLLEDLRDSLSAEEDRLEASATDLTAAQQLLESARDEFEEAERERRKVNEELEEAEGNPEERTKRTRELQLAELASSAAQETVTLRRTEIEVKTLREEICTLRSSYLTSKIERIEKEVKFTERDFQSRLTDISKSREELKRKLRETENRLRQIEMQRSATIAELEEGDATKSEMAMANEAFQMGRRVHHELMTLVQQRLGELEHYKHFLSCRFEMASGTSKKEDVREWAEQLDGLRERLKQTENSLTMRLEQIRVDQATLYRRTRQLEDSHSQNKQWIDFQTEHLQRLAEACESGLIGLKSNRRMLKRFAMDMEEVTETVQGPRWIDKARESLDTLWHYEIASVDDRPITVAKITSGLFYLLIGMVFARVLSRMIASRLLPRFGFNEGAKHAAQSIIFYTLTVVFSLLTLEVVNLPFAAFTFLGGAVAIGLGFGSQNILNNFISGLILLAEQPIRVGDLVEIDGAYGTVEQIGARSTRVKTVSNHEIIVPNSKLLENKVTNLTLSDNQIQTAIGITLSPTLSVDEVRELLFAAAHSHPSVLRSPKPVVLFKEFSMTAMSFELHFSIKLSSLMGCRVVESEVREQINRALGHTDAATTPIATATQGKTEVRVLRNAG